MLMIHLHTIVSSTSGLSEDHTWTIHVHKYTLVSEYHHR